MRNLLRAIKEKLAKFFDATANLIGRFLDVCDKHPIVVHCVGAVYYGLSFCWVVPAVIATGIMMASNFTLVEIALWIIAGGLMFVGFGLPGAWVVILAPCFVAWLYHTMMLVQWVVEEALRVEPCSLEEV